MAKEILTQEELKRQLHYNPDTGDFTWLISNANQVKIGDIAGGSNKTNDYSKIMVNNKKYPAHRLAWLYMKGYFPEYEVDHKNGIIRDNRWKNLRHVTSVCNAQNQKIRKTNTSGFPGISWDNQCKKWRGTITINGKQICLGRYKNIVEAALARFTIEMQCPNWTCNYRSELVKMIKSMWPEFKFGGR